ncbi:hypothetical protein [Marinobacter sp. LQ44]|uniref:hypothetical protein n=1 Tax=unclassified Marinobacter TaxID=83889 RepID=UPI000718BB1E|nr:hypothetical protein [Marinobacter sp. LQ44]AMQ89387.1 hypothetical protein ASQ50_12125 [Marinobacter sp. LQ44]
MKALILEDDELVGELLETVVAGIQQGLLSVLPDLLRKVSNDLIGVAGISCSPLKPLVMALSMRI